jgi:hypothetical protein
LHNPLQWNEVRKLADSKYQSSFVAIDGENVECAVVSFTWAPGVTSKVYLAIDKSFLPVKHEVYNTSADSQNPIFTMSVEKLLRAKDSESTVWFPMTVMLTQKSIKLPQNPNFETGYKHSYIVDENSIRINESIDPGTFTLDYKDIRSVHLDDDKVYLPAKDVTIDLSDRGTKEKIVTAKQESNGWSWMTFLIVLNASALVIILLVIRKRRA